MNCIHFLNTGASDCIILESAGRFAMIDAAEDSDYPPSKPMLKYRGYEKEVVDYLVSRCAGQDGIVRLDFVLGTHAHSDHIGGFDTVIDDPRITVQRAFLKPYDESTINYYERTQWDNREVYEQMLGALKRRGVPVTSEFDGLSLTLGEMKITFFNGSVEKHSRKTGENENSVVTLVECDGCRALLSGDMNNKVGGEKKLAPLIGKVQLLKLGHHGYVYSSSRRWLKTLNPDITVVCNRAAGVHKPVLMRLKLFTHARLYATVDSNGLKAIFKNGAVEMQTDIM